MKLATQKSYGSYASAFWGSRPRATNENVITENVMIFETFDRAEISMYSHHRPKLSHLPKQSRTGSSASRTGLTF